MSEMPDYWAVGGWCNTLKKLHINADVAFYGNSITYNSCFDETFACDSLVIINLGYPGDDIKGMINRIDMLVYCHPRKIFLMAGINGLKEQSLYEFDTSFNKLVDSICSKMPSSKLYLQSILPTNPNKCKDVAPNDKIIEANTCIQNIARRYNLTYIDLHKLYLADGILSESFTVDGVHLKPYAYRLWADEINKYIFEE